MLDTERTAGSRPYLEVLEELHELLVPMNYFEVGVRWGDSLRLAKCNAIAVDPAPNLRIPLPANATLHQMTSDQFFELAGANDEGEVIDFAFIDGMHHFEFALRDFMNIERYAGPGSVVVLDDIFPNHPLQAAREIQTRIWMGDIWRIRECLTAYRPDLALFPLDTHPSGLLLVLGLNAADRTLSSRYDEIVDRYVTHASEVPPDRVLQRLGAIPPTEEVLRAIANLATRLRASS